jgi:molybdopterin-guanine dinucleotide biosynthesis protein A
VIGTVLCGGRSTRMGTDKAFIEVGGRPMVLHVADALTAAGCAPVLAIGGSRTDLEALGLEVVDDAWPGEGPLGGIVTALRVGESLGADIVVIAGCDLPFLSAATLARLVDAVGAGDVALAATDRDEPLCAAWSVSACARAVGSSFDSGERAVHRAMAPLLVARVPAEQAELRNLNRPDDLIGL